MLPTAHIIHHSPGRLRIRIPEKRKNTDYFFDLEEKVQSMEGTLRVQATPLTGSLLIEHRYDIHKMLNDAKKLGLFDCDMRKVPEKRELPPITDLMKQTWVVKGLMVLGTLQMLRGRPLAPSSSLFMDAYRLWLTHHRS